MNVACWELLIMYSSASVPLLVRECIQTRPRIYTVEEPPGAIEVSTRRVRYVLWSDEKHEHDRALI